MAGYVIHLAIGKEYAKKNRVKNESDIIRGSIAPDLKDKKQSHYLDENR